MENLTDSDVTMIATKNFNSILTKIQSSGLNYSLKVSPFWAFISLRKKLVKDISGRYVIPLQSETLEHCCDRLLLEEKVTSLQQQYEELLKAHEAANETIKLQRNMLKEQDDTIEELSVANDAFKNEAFLNKVRYQEEKNNILREHQQEVSTWNKDLGFLLNNQQCLEYKYQRLSLKPELPELSSSPIDMFSVGTRQLSQLEDDLCTEYFVEYDEEPIGHIHEEEDFKTVFSSFHTQASQIAPSFVSHWISPEESSFKSLSNLASLRSHYIRLPNPGNEFLSNEDIAIRLEKLLEDYMSKIQDSNKQS